MNTALAKVCFDTVKILEGIAKELLSTMEKLGSKKIAENFRKDLNTLANEWKMNARNIYLVLE